MKTPTKQSRRVKSLKNRHPLSKKSLPSQFAYGVFLGGACNPTTWRQDQAIPYLEAQNISFYNPQVEEWSPDLIAKEREAKESSFILLFVFDPTLTRGLASFLEVAYLAAKGRVLVIVRPNLHDFQYMVTGEHVSAMEAKCMLEAFKWLDSMKLQDNVTCFEHLSDALEHIAVRYQNQRRHRYQRTDDPQSAKSPKKVKRSTRRSSNISEEQLHQAFMHFPCSPQDTLGRQTGSDRLFLGGSTDLYEFDSVMKPLKDERKSCVLARRTFRDFTLSRAVQSHCSALYFYISSDNFWLVDQLEAAYAIGKGENVTICIEEISSRISAEGTRSRDSGFNSLASTPEEKDQPVHPTALTADHREQSMLKNQQDVFLSASAVKDHNRCRSYLKSLVEETNTTVRFIDRPETDLCALFL